MYPLAEIRFGSGAEAFAANLITGGTTFFVFISGYMFQHVFCARFSYGRFMLGKCRTVLIPYVVISIPFILWFLHSAPPQGVANYATFAGWTPASDAGVQLAAALKLFLTGKFNIAAWYIPFVMILFAMSPFHKWFAGQNRMAQIAIVAAWFVLALLMHRPPGNLNPVQSVVYFSPVYLIGILCAQNKETLLRWMEGKEWQALLAVAVVNAVQVGLGRQGNYHSSLLSYDGIDLMLLQKTLLTIALFCLFERRVHISPPLVSLVSASSFALFFLHPAFLVVLPQLGYVPLLGGGWGDLVLVTALVCVVCLALALGMKQLCGPRSRYLLGY